MERSSVSSASATTGHRNMVKTETVQTNVTVKQGQNSLTDVDLDDNDYDDDTVQTGDWDIRCAALRTEAISQFERVMTLCASESSEARAKQLQQLVHKLKGFTTVRQAADGVLEMISNTISAPTRCEGTFIMI